MVVKSSPAPAALPLKATRHGFCSVISRPPVRSINCSLPPITATIRAGAASTALPFDVIARGRPTASSVNERPQTPTAFFSTVSGVNGLITRSVSPIGWFHQPANSCASSRFWNDRCTGPSDLPSARSIVAATV